MRTTITGKAEKIQAQESLIPFFAQAKPRLMTVGEIPWPT